MSADHEEFLGHYLAHQNLLRAYIVGVVRDWHLADDIMQELGMVLWRNWDRYDRDRPFGAWARGIASKLLLKNRDKLRRRREVFSPEALAALADAYEGFEAEDDSRLVALERCVEHLDERAQRMLELRYTDDHDIAGVARQLQRKPEAVGKALQRLRRALASCVERQLAGAAHGR